MPYKIEFKQQLPISLEQAWKFFSSPYNLPLITPNSLGLVILDKPSEVISQDDEINYSVTPILGIKTKWKTLITEVKVNHSFVDKQIEGPYKLWEHLHVFEANKDGVLMYDKINYELPFGLLGRIFHPLIKKKLNSIFTYRKNKLHKLISQNDLI